MSRDTSRRAEILGNNRVLSVHYDVYYILYSTIYPTILEETILIQLTHLGSIMLEVIFGSRVFQKCGAEMDDRCLR